MPPKSPRKTKSVRSKPAIWARAIIIGVVLGVLIWRILSSAPPENKSVIMFEQVTVSVEIADTPSQRYQGLSGRQALPDKTGMVFVFSEANHHEFHMKDMNFAIDIIWMDGSGRIVDITPSLPPDSYPETVTSDEPARYVLEVPGGFAERYDVAVGDTPLVQLK